MSTSTFSLFFALLSLVSWAGALGVGALALVPRSPRGDDLRADVGRVAPGLAWAVATVTTAGSLYYSKVVGYPPCELCWYQRIAMYPLVVILGIALVRRRRDVAPYALGLCAVGAPISAYHSWIQAFPPDELTTFCTPEAPCTFPYVWELGFVSLPLMALSAFAFIAALMAATRWDPDGEVATPDDDDAARTEALT